MALVDSCILCQRLLWVTNELCASCRRDLDTFSLIRRNVGGLDVFSLLYYRPPAEAFVRRCKLKENAALTRTLSLRAARKLAFELVVPVIGVIPAPARVFGDEDHAFAVAEGAAELFRAPICPRFFARIASDPQKEKVREERLKIKFELREPILNDRDGIWILADDVVTTGATLHQAWTTLGKPKAVGLTLASTPRLKDFAVWPS